MSFKAGFFRIFSEFFLKYYSKLKFFTKSIHPHKLEHIIFALVEQCRRAEAADQ